MQNEKKVAINQKKRFFRELMKMALRIYEWSEQIQISPPTTSQNTFVIANFLKATKSFIT
ncbi:hypothetical protein CW304_12205 [Bacillus sp. UFRGS-B20]|nr:hypothetical protein CW304_12205 [Bacillus sp. UFRGS-B20]